MPAPFDLAAIEQAIAGTQFSGHLHHFATVASTNDLALAAAQAGTRLGVWIADEQTAGRGRGNHAWHSAPGDGLYMSVLIAPAVPLGSALQLSFATALAVQSAIVSVTNLRQRNQLDIRWPNDLLLNGRDGIARKCGGILIETAAQGTELRYLVIGIGINCNHTSFPPELDAIATSLRRELADPSQTILREPLVAAVLTALEEEINRMVHTPYLVRDLNEFSTWLSGKAVHVDEDGGYTGVTAGLDPRGFLRVTGDDGKLHIVRSGGVRTR
jgi:BirA family transcriptional regulator, biotin operon repressor / biotin---[acetyl-CoA-carboxylase] ligase